VRRAVVQDHLAEQHHASAHDRGPGGAEARDEDAADEWRPCRVEAACEMENFGTCWDLTRLTSVRRLGARTASYRSPAHGGAGT
jgi:hypothetical protein